MSWAPGLIEGYPTITSTIGQAIVILSARKNAQAIAVLRYAQLVKSDPAEDFSYEISRYAVPTEKAIQESVGQLVAQLNTKMVYAAGLMRDYDVVSLAHQSLVEMKTQSDADFLVQTDHEKEEFLIRDSTAKSLAIKKKKPWLQSAIRLIISNPL